MADDSLVHVQELLESAQASLKTASSLLRELTGVADVSRVRKRVWNVVKQRTERELDRAEGKA